MKEHFRGSVNQLLNWSMTVMDLCRGVWTMSLTVPGMTVMRVGPEAEKQALLHNSLHAAPAQVSKT